MTYVPDIEPDPREDKLPRWARELLANARRRVETAEAQAEAARLATSPDETDTVVYGYSQPHIGLPSGATVEFRLDGQPGGRDHVHCRVETTKWGAWLDVHGGETIRITPRSTNGIRITVEH